LQAFPRKAIASALTLRDRVVDHA